MISTNRMMFVFLFMVIGAALLCAPDIVFAAPPLATGTKALKNDLIDILTPIIGIGMIGLGLACGFGKISWWWFAGAVVGIVLVFGHDQILSWIRGLFSV